MAAINVQVTHQNIDAQFEIDWSYDASVSTSAPSTEEAILTTPTQPSFTANSPAQYYSPVGIILATCALVTAIGKALRDQ